MATAFIPGGPGVSHTATAVGASDVPGHSAQHLPSLTPIRSSVLLGGPFPEDVATLKGKHFIPGTPITRGEGHRGFSKVAVCHGWHGVWALVPIPS